MDDRVDGKLLRGRYKKINTPVHHLHWDYVHCGDYVEKKLKYLLMWPGNSFDQIEMFVTYKNSLHLLSGHALQFVFTILLYIVENLFLYPDDKTVEDSTRILYCILNKIYWTVLAPFILISLSRTFTLVFNILYNFRS